MQLPVPIHVVPVYNINFSLFYFYFLEIIPTAVGGTALSPRAVTLFQDTRGETHSLSRFLNKPVGQVEDVISSCHWLSCSIAHIHKLTRLPGFFLAGRGQLPAVRARCLGQGQSVDDRLREDGASAGS